MNHTPVLGLTQYEEGDKFRITHETDSLNKDMQIIEGAIGEKMDEPTNEGTTDQILRKSSDGSSRWDNAATQTEIGDAVTAWLGENVPTGTTVVVDRSLSIEDAAADAKETGSQISNLKSAVKLYYTLNDFAFSYGGVYNGSINTDTNRIHSNDMIQVFSGMHIKFDGTYNGLWIASYNADGTYKSNGAWTKDATIDFNGYVRIVLRKPSDAQIAQEDFAGLIDSVQFMYHGVTVLSYLFAENKTNKGNITAIQTDINAFKADSEVMLGCAPIEYNTSGKIYNLSGTTAPMENGVPKPDQTAANYKSGYIACSAGDLFTLSFTGGVTARGYAFIASDGTILEKPNASVVVSNKVYTAPENSAFLIIQTSGGETSYKGTTVPYKWEQLSQQLSQIDDFQYLVTNGYYTRQTATGYAIKNNVNVGSAVDLTPVEADNLASIVVEAVNQGMKFRVFGTGTYNYVIWAWLDKDNKLISKANTWTSSGASGVVIEAPQNAKKLVCSSNASYQYGFNVQYLGATDYLEEKIDNIGDNTELVEPNMKRYADFSFSFFSDIHGGDVNFQHIIQHAEDNELDVIINGGDTALRYLDDPDNSIDWYATDVNTSSVDILSAVGNHDVWTGAYWTKASATDIYNTFIKPLVTKFSDIVQPSSAEANGLCYYYKDYGTVRVIIINAMDGSTSVDFWDTAQATWFENVLADAKTNSKHVIVCNHSPFPKNIALRDEKSDWNSWIDYRTYSGSDGIVMKTEALDLIKAFTDGGGKLICLLTGHEHVDSILTATGYEGQFMFNTASAMYANHPDGLTYSSTDSKYYDCFNYCTVDTTHTILKVWRVGWCMDASMKKRELFSYNYGTNKLLHD